MTEWLDDTKPEPKARKSITVPSSIKNTLHYLGIAILTIPGALGFAWLSSNVANGPGDPSMFSFISGLIAVAFFGTGIALIIQKMVRDAQDWNQYGTHGQRSR